MKILHTSDWHLGQHFYGKSRAPEHKKFLNWLLTQVDELQLDAIIVAGDIFDTGTPPSYARELYFDFISQLHAKACQLVILAGNHDSVAMLSEAKQVLKQLSTHVISSASENTEQQLVTLHSPKNDNQNNDEHLIVCAIPFIRPRDVMKSQSGQSAQDKQLVLQHGIANHYQTLFEQAQQQANGIAKKTGKVPAILMTGHLTTVGVKTSDSVRDIYIGTLDAFPANAFPAADYIALGHIHKSQKVAKSEHIRYCGSPIPLSFDEAKQEKVALLVEFSQGKLSCVNEVVIPRFQPMAMLKTDIEGLHQDIEALIASHTPEDESQTLWLDVEITSTGYLQDMSQRISELTKDTLLEVLLVRRSKETRQKMSKSSNQITLNELTVDEVFEARVANENWQAADELERKGRLTTLFHQYVEKVSHTSEADDKEQTS